MHENMKKDTQQESRYSGIELLRILTICGVILLHYNDGRAFKWVVPGTANQYILFGVESIFICAVDLFMVISGYFLSQTQKRTVIKPLELFFQITLFNVCFTIYRMSGAFSLWGLIKASFPTNYFVTLYVVVYILSPWINILIKAINSLQRRKLMITICILFLLMPTLADLMEECVGKEIMGINTVGAWGAQQGFTAINFMLCYMIGAYLSFNEKYMAKFKKIHLLIIYLFSTLIIFVWSIACEHLVTFGLRSAWEYCNPLVVLQAVSLFLIFKKFLFHNTFVNRMAKSVFTCFLVHGRLLGYMRIEEFVLKAPHVMLLHMLITAIILYSIGWCVWWIYNACSKKVVKGIGAWIEKRGIDLSVN